MQCIIAIIVQLANSSFITYCTMTLNALEMLLMALLKAMRILLLCIFF